MFNKNDRKHYRTLPPHRHRGGKLISDIKPTQPPAPFPSVGMSLPSYQRSQPSARPIASPRPVIGVPPAAKPGFGARLRRRLTVKRIILIIVIIVALIGCYVGGKFLWNAFKIFRGNIFGALTTTKLKGEDTGHVNILLAGNSADDVGHEGADLTDSIMILSINTRNNTAFMLSVPRDLWVDIPNHGYAKINEAYVDGQQDKFSESGYPSGGMGLLEQVIEQNFGIDLDYYALVNYDALRDSVNAVGGINLTINSSDPRGLYDPSIDYATGGPLVKLTNGMHHLDGEQALDLARARGDAYGSYGFAQSDFDRTQHQRQMLLALKEKVTSTGVLANPVKLTNLFDALGKNVRTDLTVSEARRLYDITKPIDNAKVKSVGLNNVDGKDLLANYTTSLGQSALIPAAGIDNYSQIQQYIRKLTTNDPVLKEGASVVVLNGTDRYGLASDNSKKLAAHSINVIAIGDTAEPAGSTTIIDASAGKKPATLALLKKLYGPTVTTTNPYANLYDADFIVVLGADQPDEPNTTTPSDL